MNDELLEIIEVLADKKDTLSSKLEALVDEYWVSWRDTNRNIIAKSSNPDFEGRVGKVAPSIRIYPIKNQERIVLRWRIYDNSWARMNIAKPNKETLRYAKEMKRNKDGTTSRLKLEKISTTWEMELVDAFLVQANPIIVLINCLHTNLKSLNKLNSNQTGD